MITKIIQTVKNEKEGTNSKRVRKNNMYLVIMYI